LNYIFIYLNVIILYNIITGDIIFTYWIIFESREISLGL